MTFNVFALLRAHFGGTQFCQCGHERTAHKHYRKGSDCALCGECPQYRPAAIT